MKRFLLVLLVLVCIIFSNKKITKPHTLAFVNTPTIKPSADTRVASLNNFFETYKCPKPYYIDDYLKYADEYKVDYRLLPSISVQESSCGRHACGTNYWGWQSCNGITFKSVTQGIEYVTQQLANNHYYAGKTNYQKLRAYNPNPSYAQRVLKLINSIQ